MGIIVKFTGEEKVKIIDMFKSGFSLKEIADILKRHQSSIGRFLRKKGFKTNSYFGKDTSGVIAKLYEEGKSLNDIAKILNINIISAYNHCLKNNIKMRPVGSKLDISNKDFFKNLNKDSAYMLGLFIADGSLSQKKKRVALSLKLEDKYLIEKFKELIGSDHKINICRNMSAITVQDDYFFNTLVDLGLPSKRKTYNLDGCEKLFVKINELKLMPYFIRGFLDGDGSIYFSKKKYFHKVSFTGFSDQFLKSINEFIMLETGITTGYFYKRKNSNVWSLSYSGNKRVRIFLNWLYNDKNIFMKRKYEKAKMILNIT